MRAIAIPISKGGDWYGRAVVEKPTLWAIATALIDHPVASLIDPTNGAKTTGVAGAMVRWERTVEKAVTAVKSQKLLPCPRAKAGTINLAILHQDRCR